MKEKDWSKYQNDTLDDKVENLLIEFLNNYNNINGIVDLGCGAGNESVYLLKRGYKVTSIDRQLNKNYILDRLTDKEKNNVSFIESDFKDLVIPKTDWVNTFSKDEIIKKLSKYDILLFDEIEYVRETDNKKWHYFNIIAKKNKN